VDADVIIIGSGFAGSCAAYVLSAQGIRSLVIERCDPYPKAFRAEKIEPNQAEALRKFGMLDFRKPLAGPLGKTLNYRNGVLKEFDTIEQYGMHYTNTVNSFREQLRERCASVIARATAIRISDNVQTVETESGSYSARLVIAAAGGRDNLLTPLGITRRYQPSLISLSFAFHIKPENVDHFEFSGFNYFLEPPVDGLDYATIFRIGDIMRVNLFTRLDTKSPLLREFKNSPKEEMQKYFPDLEQHIGPYSITTKVQSFPTTFYRLRGTDKPGIVVIGDDYQAVNPVTGTGLDKVTTDVDRLCYTYIPEWVRTPGMGREKIACFYRDEIKRKVDYNSMQLWIAYRDKHRGFFGNQLSRLELHFNNLFARW
jgi:flavin-dependent dehydrogenase